MLYFYYIKIFRIPKIIRIINTQAAKITNTGIRFVILVVCSTNLYPNEKVKSKYRQNAEYFSELIHSHSKRIKIKIKRNSKIEERMLKIAEMSIPKSEKIEKSPGCFARRLKNCCSRDKARRARTPLKSIFPILVNGKRNRLKKGSQTDFKNLENCVLGEGTQVKRIAKKHKIEYMPMQVAKIEKRTPTETLHFKSANTHLFPNNS